DLRAAFGFDLHDVFSGTLHLREVDGHAKLRGTLHHQGNAAWHSGFPAETIDAVAGFVQPDARRTYRRPLDAKASLGVGRRLQFVGRVVPMAIAPGHVAESHVDFHNWLRGLISNEARNRPRARKLAVELLPQRPGAGIGVSRHARHEPFRTHDDA